MILTPGTTSYSLDVQILDDTGLAVTGLVAATFPSVSYSVGNNTAATSITLSDLAAITTAYTSGGVKERSGGWYRLDLPNATISSSGTITLIGEASGKHLIAPKIQVQKTAATIATNDMTDISATRAAKIDNLDAAVSSRSTYSGADTAGTGTLLNRLPGVVSFDGSGNVKTTLQAVLATALTETTAGNLAAAFKKFLDVSAPALTAASVNQTGDSFARIGANGANLTALGDTRIASAATIAAAVEAAILNDSDGEAVLQAIINKINSVDADLSGLSISAIAQAAAALILATPANKIASNADGSVDANMVSAGGNTLGGGGIGIANMDADYRSNNGLNVSTASIGTIQSGLATEANATSNKNAVITAVGDATAAATNAETAADAAASNASDAKTSADAASTAATAIKTTTDLLATTWTVTNGIAAFTAGALAAAPTGGSSGTGAYTVIVPVTDGTNPLQNVTVSMTLNGVAYTATTDSGGNATFNLGAGTYTRAAVLNGYQYAGDSQPVTGSATLATIVMTATLLPVAPNPSQCRIYFSALGADGLPKDGVRFDVRVTAGPAGVNDSINSKPRPVVSNSSDPEVMGMSPINAYFDVLQGSKGTICRGVGGSQLQFAAPTAGTALLSDLIQSDLLGEDPAVP